MKIRNGYVSNSSSSSFVMLASTFHQSDIRAAINSLFDFYELDDNHRKQLIDYYENINEPDKYRYYELLESLLSYCHPIRNAIGVRFGNRENGLEPGLGYFVYYYDASDECGYYEEREPENLDPYIETSKKLQEVCDKNLLDLSNIQSIRGVACT